jgi:hypothetical protein
MQHCSFCRCAHFLEFFFNSEYFEQLCAFFFKKILNFKLFFFVDFITTTAFQHRVAEVILRCPTITPSIVWQCLNLPPQHRGILTVGIGTWIRGHQVDPQANVKVIAQSLEQVGQVDSLSNSPEQHGRIRDNIDWLVQQAPSIWPGQGKHPEPTRQSVLNLIC